MRDIIVIGASAGGIAALEEVVARLPADLPAAVFVTLHVPARRKSALPEILSRRGALPAEHPLTRQSIEPGHIYVAPPDCHLLVEHGTIHLSRGPKEDRHRPSINACFRSAAESYGERVIGVVLSGAMDDGTAGLWWIKELGGVTVVQDPAESEFPGMPLAALENVAVDYVARSEDIGGLLDDLARGKAPLVHRQRSGSAGGSGEPGGVVTQLEREICRTK